MKQLIFTTLLLVSLNEATHAAKYEGKKFKITLTKDPATGQHTAEGEVWDTTKSEHLFMLKFQSEKPPGEQPPAQPDPSNPPVK